MASTVALVSVAATVTAVASSLPAATGQTGGLGLIGGLITSPTANAVTPAPKERQAFIAPTAGAAARSSAGSSVTREGAALGISMPLSSFMPLGRSNTPYRSQPLSANIVDHVGRLATQGITFTLRDLTTGVSQDVPATSFTGGTAATAPVSLTGGHTYSMVVTARDSTGHFAQADQGTNLADGFRVVDATITPTTATLAPTHGVAAVALPGSAHLITFPHVFVNLDAAMVKLSGTQHAGFGYVTTRLDLGSVELCVDNSALTCVPARTPTNSPWPSPTVSTQFATLVPHTSESLNLSAGALNHVDVGPLTASVPGGWSAVSLRMTPMRVQGTFPTCASPIGSDGFPGCTSDPLRFFLPDAAASRLDAETGHVQDTLRAPSHGSSTTSASLAPSLSTKLEYLFVQPCATCPFVRLGATPYVPAFNTAGATAVRYPDGYPVLRPDQYAAVCRIVTLCASANAQLNEGYFAPTGGSTYAAVNVSGLWYNPGECCAVPTPQHQAFSVSGSSITCYDVSDNYPPDCSSFTWGIADSDGSKDGVAEGWIGGWATNYQSMTAEYLTPVSGCRYTSTWYYQPPNPATTNTNPPLDPDQWTGNELSYQYPNQFSSDPSCGSTVNLAGFGVLSDMYETSWHGNENGTLSGSYEHTTHNVSWQWDYSCGTDSCAVTATPQDSTDAWTEAAYPANYEY
jgi:hypothetical protein